MLPKNYDIPKHGSEATKIVVPLLSCRTVMNPKKKATAYTNAICLIFSINGLHLTVKQRQPNSCGNTPSQSSTSQNPDRQRSVLSKHFLGIIFQIFHRMRQNKLCQQNFQQLDGCVFDTVGHRHISRQTKGPKRCYINNLSKFNGHVRNLFIRGTYYI